FFIVSFLRPNGGTTLFSPETTCFSSGRKNGFASGVPRVVIPCGRWSQWTSYGRSPLLGIRRAYKKTRAVRSPMRYVPSSQASAWKATFGIRSRIVSVNEFASFASSEHRGACVKRLVRGELGARRGEHRCIGFRFSFNSK